MSDVVISAHQPTTPWSYGGTTFTVRYFYNQPFLDDLGRWTLQGDGQTGFYIEVAGTIDGAGILHIPDSTIISPLGGRQPNTLCSAQLFDENGTGRDFLFTDWTIPQTTPTTFGALEIVNENKTLANILGYVLTTAQILQVQALINIALGLLNKASAVIYGHLRLDVSPASASDPVAVGLNSRRTLSMYNVTATAIGAVADGTTDNRAALNTLVNTALQITGAGGDVYFPPGAYSIQSNMAFPANVRLVFDPRAMLKPANGVTITLLCPIEAGPYQIFTNALPGQGTVTLRSGDAGQSKVFQSFVEWWGGNADGITDNTAAFIAATLASARVQLLAGEYGFASPFRILPHNFTLTGDTRVGSDIIPLATNISAVTITGITNASPCVITLPAHGLTNGQTMTIVGASGSLGTAINGAQVVTVLSADTFSIPVNTTTTSIYAGGATLTYPNALFVNAQNLGNTTFEYLRWTSLIGFTGWGIWAEDGVQGGQALFSGIIKNCWVSMGTTAAGFFNGALQGCFIDKIESENTAYLFHLKGAGNSGSCFTNIRTTGNVNSAFYSVDSASNGMTVRGLQAFTQLQETLIYVTNGTDWIIDGVQLEYDAGGTVPGGLAQFDTCTRMIFTNFQTRRTSGRMAGILIKDSSAKITNGYIYNPSSIAVGQAVSLTGANDVDLVNVTVHAGTIPHLGMVGSGDIRADGCDIERSESTEIIVPSGVGSFNFTLRNSRVMNGNYNKPSAVPLFDIATTGDVLIENNVIGVDDVLAVPTARFQFTAGSGNVVIENNQYPGTLNLTTGAGSTQPIFTSTLLLSAMPSTSGWKIGSFVSNSAPTATVAVSGITNANPAVFTTSSAHGLVSGQSTTIAGAASTLGTAVNGARIVTVLSSTTFSIPVDTSATSVYGGTGATATVNVLLGWKRLTTGTGNVAGTDWAIARGLTGN